MEFLSRKSHGKKVALTRLENDPLTLQNVSFCVHSLAFSDREIRAFSFVFQMVNSSFPSLIRQFSTKVNNRKTSRFPGFPRVAIAPLKTDCFLLLYGRFPVTKQRVDWCLLEFCLIYLMMNARLTHGIKVVLQYFLICSNYKATHSLEFLGSFLAFSRTVNGAKCQKPACSSPFTSWLTLENTAFSLKKTAMFSRIDLLSRVFCICSFSISMVSYMHLEICWVALLPNFVVFTFSFTLSSQLCRHFTKDFHIIQYC